MHVHEARTHIWLASLKPIQLLKLRHVNVSLEERGTFILRKAEDSTCIFFLSLLIITEIAGMHDPGRRLGPERVQQKHHHLQLCSPLWVSPVGCHPHWAWVRSKYPPWRLYTLLQRAKLLRLRRKKKSRSRATENIALWARRCSLIANWLKKRTKITWRANNHKASELASEARALLSNSAVIQIVEQLDFGARNYHMCAIQTNTVSFYIKILSK